MPGRGRGAPRSESARQAILHATAAQLDEKGWPGLTIEGIAAAAGVGKPTIYRWWRTKTALVAEAIAEGVLLQSTPDVHDTGDLRADLEAWLDAMLRFSGDSGSTSLFRSLIAAAAEDDEVGRLLERTNPAPASLAARLSVAAERRELPGWADPAAIVDALFGTIVLSTMRRAPHDPERARALATSALGPQGQAQPPQGQAQDPQGSERDDASDDRRGSAFTVRPLSPADAAAVQHLLEAGGGFTERIRGRAPAPGDGLAILTDLPPDAAPEAKLVLGLLSSGPDTGPEDLLGLVDVIRDWPEPGTAHIGLLLTHQDHRGRGLGRLLHESLLAQLRALGGTDRLRIGIVATNSEVAAPFWERLGYLPTGEVRPFADGPVRSTTTILARPLAQPPRPPEAVAESPEAAAGPSGAGPAPLAGLHHLELWTSDLRTSEPAWDWLLGVLGWHREVVPGWDEGRTWRHGDSSYIVLEQSPDVVGSAAERRRPGMNHVALRLSGGADPQDRVRMLDELRALAPEHGWSELYADRYPHAGGDRQLAWYAESAEGIEVEVVAD